MYPGNAKKFMGVFNQATQKPYGYLMVDLKPMTEESARLRSNTPENCEYSKHIEGGEQLIPNQLTFDPQTEHIAAAYELMNQNTQNLQWISYFVLIVALCTHLPRTYKNTLKEVVQKQTIAKWRDLKNAENG
jgi:hypothetical protein